MDNCVVNHLSNNRLKLQTYKKMRNVPATYFCFPITKICFLPPVELQL